MRPETTSRPAGAPRALRPARRLHAVPDPALRVLDVAMFYGERSGGIRTYLDAKLAWAAGRDDVEHHLVVPGDEAVAGPPVHRVRALPVRFANGYRLPAGARALKEVIDRVRPDVVLLHDPYWRPVQVAQAAHAVGATVVAVHHGSSALDAAALPGPSRAYVPVLRTWLRHAARDVDAVMSVVDPTGDCRRAADLPLRLGVHPAFVPQPRIARRDHVLYAGRLQRQKGVFALLEAAARSAEPWPLHLLGSGPAEDALLARAERLGIADRVRVRPFEPDRARLARRYAQAACVVMPGEHETFGLVALEAAASGARVVACRTAPSAERCGALAETYAPGDVDGLLAAIERARSAPRDLAAASRLAAASTWDRCFAEELASLRELV